MDYVIRYLTGDFPNVAQYVGFFMAMFGAQTVSDGPNKDRKMAWFHALFLSALVGYGGAIFTPWMLGRQIPLFTNDFNLASVIVAFYLMHFTPASLFFNSFVGRLLITMFSTLFRALGVQLFCTLAFEASNGNPSQLGYDIMVLGPILYPTLLGNMGPLAINGLGLLTNGMPFPFQQTLFTASFYHFYVHDKSGIIGTTLRSLVDLIPGITFGLDEKKFGLLVVSTIMHTHAILKMPQFIGPSFDLFEPITFILTKVLRLNSYYGVKAEAPVSKPKPTSESGKPQTKKKKKNGKVKTN